MQFSPSPKGHQLLAYNSSRIYVISLQGPELEVKREFKILRRPAATCIKDDGSLLAVLLTEMQVDLYDLTQSPPRRTQSVILDHSPRAIALSPCGTVLAAAYEGGIEVSSLNPAALSTDRRSVKCDAVDSLSFSFDGTQILGTTVHSGQPNTVILTAPYYDPGSHMADDNISSLWTTSILFPNTSRDCSHAVLLQESSHQDASWTFTYDRSFETFRAVRIDDLRNGTTYFTGPIPMATSQSKLIPSTLPAASYHGDLVSAGFQGKEVWLYGVPEDLDAISECVNAGAESSGNASGLGRRNSGPAMRSPPRTQEAGEARVPQWQVLCDKFRNTFVGGCKIAELNGVQTVKWVASFGDSSLKERLVVAARGVMPPKPITEDDGFDFVDGGRVTLVDFDYGLEDGHVTEVTIEVGAKEPEVLEEEQRDMDTEVAIVRRRTVAQRRGNRNAVSRAATTAAHAPPVPPVPQPQQTEDQEEDPLIPRRLGAAPRQPVPEQPQAPQSPDGEAEATIEEQEALDAPYSHASPRSGTTLRRAATAAAANRRLHPEPAAAAGHIQYRRADGRAEHPHESDADNWVPPPPPYQKDDPQDLPAFLRHPAITPVTAPAVPQQRARTVQPAAAQLQQHPPMPPQPPWVQAQRSSSQPPGPTRQPMAQAPAPRPQSHQRLPSSSTTVSTHSVEIPRPMSQSTNIYDVTPPGTPRQPINSRPIAATRNNTSGSGVISAGSNYAPSLPSPETPATRPTVPRIMTSPASSPGSQFAPSLDLQIPSPTLSNLMWNTQQSDSPRIRRISNSQTWPAPPPPVGVPAVLPAGYPYSAPPTTFDANQMIAQSYPPAPRPDQLASLHQRDSQLPPPRRMSGGFQVPRVPVGSRDGDRGRRISGQQQLPPPSTHQTQGRSVGQALYQPQPQRLHQSQPSRSNPVDQISVVPPVEDQPLIISTPKGVSGAYDPPDRHASTTQRAETPIIAPIPRHPRPQPGVGPLQPTVQRLEGIYSVAPPAHHNMVPSQPGPSSYLSAPSTSTVRQSSLHRKQSRAERSAAKNMADAKRRGWGRRKSQKKKKKERDFDAASSAAWTDVTWSSAGGAGYGNYGMQQQQPPPHKDKKCVIM